MNSVNIIGRITTDIELKQTTNGVSVVSFNLAINRPKSKDGTENTDFIPVVIWREYAEVMSKHLSKGQQIGVEGRITSRPYEDKNGKKHTAIEVVADNITLLGRKADSSAASKSDKSDDVVPPV